MKRTWKRTLASCAVAAMLAGAVAIPAAAAQPTAAGPTTIDGVTYLPITVLEDLGLSIVWDEASQSYVIAVKAPSTGTGNAASAQTAGTPAANTSTAANGYIGEAKAKEIALNHAGLSVSDVNFYRAKLDYDDGRVKYEVEFWKGQTEYDYDIDAVTGEIIGFDYDIEGYTAYTKPQSNTDIGQAKAKEIALNHAGVSASDTVFVYAQSDYEHGRRVYEVEFYSGNKEYDYEIDAASGDILSYDFDAERYSVQSTSGDYIGEAEVKQIVEQRAGVSGTFVELKMDVDHGRVLYEGKMRNGWTEYEFEIDAVTGTILDWEMDWD